MGLEDFKDEVLIYIFDHQLLQVFMTLIIKK